MKRALFLIFRVTLFLPRLLLIVLLLLGARGSLALHLWGRGRLCKWIAHLYDADPGMYRRDRWKRTRKQVYWRNVDNGVFTCEATGFRSTDLGKFHVDHILSRAGFPMLAYRLDNLRLVRDRVNVAKKDRLPVWFFLRFMITNKVR